MDRTRVNRRRFIETVAGSAAALSAWPREALAVGRDDRHSTSQPNEVPDVAQSRSRIRFGVIGINHSHINGQVSAVLRGGGELVSVYAKEPDLVNDFVTRFPQVKPARSEDEILQDSTIHLVLSSAIPDERAPLGIRVMTHADTASALAVRRGVGAFFTCT